MEDNLSHAVNKILTQISSTFQKNPNLEGFEILPIENDSNKSPVSYEQNSLILASWCIQPLYCYVHKKLFALKQKQPKPFNDYNLLNVALLLNPDSLTFWNMKRKLVKNGKVDPFEELNFVNIVLRYKPKCFDVYAYRRWILKFILLQKTTRGSTTNALLPRDLDVTMKAFSNSKNILAWNHRKYIMSIFEIISVPKLDQIFLKEWDEISDWSLKNVSDYCGFEYKQFLIIRLWLFRQYFNREIKLKELKKRVFYIFEFIKLPCFKNLETLSLEKFLLLLDINHEFVRYLIKMSFLVEDLIINEELIKTYPGHEALWCHRQFLVKYLIHVHQYDANEFQLLESQSETQKNCHCEKLKNNGQLKTCKHLCQKLVFKALSFRNEKLHTSIKPLYSYDLKLSDKFLIFLKKEKLV